MNQRKPFTSLAETFLICFSSQRHACYFTMKTCRQGLETTWNLMFDAQIWICERYSAKWRRVEQDLISRLTAFHLSQQSFSWLGTIYVLATKCNGNVNAVILRLKDHLLQVRVYAGDRHIFLTATSIRTWPRQRQQWQRRQHQQHRQQHPEQIFIGPCYYRKPRKTFGTIASESVVWFCNMTCLWTWLTILYRVLW